MDRKARLLNAAGEGTEQEAELLAGLPASTVDAVVKLVRAARRDAIRKDRERRKERRQQRRKHGWHDDGEIADAADALVRRSLGPRAGVSLDALARLKQHYDQRREVLALAVAGARAAGYSDPEIARALGMSSQGVGKVFGRRGAQAASKRTEPPGGPVTPARCRAGGQVKPEFHPAARTA